MLQQPIALGADFEINSSTKYLNGHGTGVSGIVIGADAAFMEKQLWKIRKLHGTIIAPFDAWMLNLGYENAQLAHESPLRKCDESGYFSFSP